MRTCDCKREAWPAVNWFMQLPKEISTCLSLTAKTYEPVVAVVHEVVDGVNARARAGVAASGSAERLGSLSGGVRDLVAGAGAAALEGVVETNPVASLVRQSLLEVMSAISKERRGTSRTLPRL